jgi:hypothetical protein
MILGSGTISYVLNDPNKTELMTETLCEDTRVPCKGERVVIRTYGGDYSKLEYRVACVVNFIDIYKGDDIAKHYYQVILEDVTQPENEKSAGSVVTDYWSR